MLLPTWTTVGFTGHRKLDNPQCVADAIRTVLDELEAGQGLLAAAASAASGADTLFIEEVVRRGAPMALILPATQEEFRQDFTDEAWRRVAVHFDRALRIHEVRDVDSRGEAYLEAGVLTVDEADVLLAVWDGRPAAGPGGTAEIVAYARACEKPLVVIHPLTGAVLRERLDALAQRDPAAPQVTLDASPRDAVARQYAEFDATAQQHAPKSRRLIVRVIWLHLVATAIGVTGSALDLPGPLGQSFNGLKLAALGLALYYTSLQRRAHHQWRGARLAAEICRSYLAIWPLRRRGERLPPLIADELATLHRSLQITWFLDRGAERPLAEARDAYIVSRIHDQLNYFNQKYKSDGAWAPRLKTFAVSATIAAFALNAAGIGMSLQEISGPAQTVTKWFSSMIGLIPPAIWTLLMGLDLTRRAERFDGATAKLKRAERRLSQARTWPSLWRIVADTERFLLREVAEWHALTRSQKKR